MTKALTPTIALLRAVNVGGTGKLPMTELRSMADELGLANARTYIASGNLLFDTDLDEAQVKTRLEERLHAFAGKPIGVMVRTAAEMAAVVAGNPFADCPGNRVIAIFLDDAPPADALDDVRHQDGERLALGRREIYVHYGDGMGTSRLVIPAAKAGTARNMNTAAKLAALSIA
ncbi:DUF1697 domain-containing protein [Sphingomonas rhizophila]|uniref:DUF1697 domain-containing protein n=1 Tax=Sphingomonas rhizophila TaxID=2071607 RepID=UPI001CB6EB1F|nr:DUF1697 domain-containing protein [Sphingomonas rhizophila]